VAPWPSIEARKDFVRAPTARSSVVRDALCAGDPGKLLQDLDIDFGEADESRTPRNSRAGEESETQTRGEGEGATAGSQASDEGSPAEGRAEDAQGRRRIVMAEMMAGFERLRRRPPRPAGQDPRWGRQRRYPRSTRLPASASD